MTMQTEAIGSDRRATIWRPMHAYLMAVVCLLIGVAIGYLVRARRHLRPALQPLPLPQSERRRRQHQVGRHRRQRHHLMT